MKNAHQLLETTQPRPTPNAEEVAAIFIPSNNDAYVTSGTRSVVNLALFVAKQYGDQMRRNRPESVVWHPMRVAGRALAAAPSALRIRNRELLAFCALAHDLGEDKGIPSNVIAAKWNGTTDERSIITNVLDYKTDAPNTHGYDRRAAQLVKAQNAQELPASIGRFYSLVVYADKLDNMIADGIDLQAGRLTFKDEQSAHKQLAQKVTDLCIVEALPTKYVCNRHKSEFRAAAHQVTALMMQTAAKPAPRIAHPIIMQAHSSRTRSVS